MSEQKMVNGVRPRDPDKEYPADTCPQCLRQYWACRTCGASPLGRGKENPPETCKTCHSNNIQWAEYRWCHVSYSHHLYNFCEHCGVTG